MKLEAVNGNLLSLTGKLEQQQQQQQQQKPKEEDMLMGEEEELGGDGKEIEEERQNGENADDKEINGGKKKGVRKKRSLNWEEAERGLLLEVIKPKVEFVENRSVEAKNIKAKRLAWMQITKQFNLLNFRHRSLEQIQVQWRSMKNSAKRDYQLKRDKPEPMDAIEMIEFMEEMQKEPVNVRARGAGALKKELHDSDEEDTPLAALPTNTNTSDDTLQSSTLALPSPPVSAAESQQSETQITPTRNRKKAGAQQATATAALGAASASSLKQQTNTATIEGVVNGRMRKQRKQSFNTETVNTSVSADIILPNNQLPTSHPNSPTYNNTSAAIVHSLAADEKYRKQLFDLVKRARLAEMDFARREHEQRLRHQELKWNLCRQQEELKLKHLREEHETKMRQYKEEHEARLLAYTIPVKRLNVKSAKNAIN